MQPLILPLSIYLIAGMVGIVAHYVSKWAHGEIAGNLLHYFFIDEPRWTVATLVGFYVSAAAMLAAGGITVNTDPMTLVGAGFGIGYACDSAITKGVSNAK